MWQEGRHSLQDVGDAHNLSRERVRQILVKNGITERYVKQKFNDDLERQLNIEAVNQAVDRYRNGEYLGNVVKDIGISEHLVKKLRPVTEDDKRHHLLSKLYKHIEIGTIPDGFDTPCLEWTGNYFGKYPRFRYGKETYVTRIMWYLEHGEWPIGVRRSCKNEKCVRHLEDK